MIKAWVYNIPIEDFGENLCSFHLLTDSGYAPEVSLVPGAVKKVKQSPWLDCLANMPKGIFCSWRWTIFYHNISMKTVLISCLSVRKYIGVRKLSLMSTYFKWFVMSKGPQHGPQRSVSVTYCLLLFCCKSV